MSDEYEYGIAMDGAVDDPHRTGMSEAVARKWIAELVEDGGPSDLFTIIRRPIGNWEKAP